MVSSNYFLFVLFLTSKFIFGVSSIVDKKAFIIWGPGLKSNFNVPVRYFYIQAVDTNGKKFDI